MNLQEGLMSDAKIIDSRGYSFEEWLRFVFDHPVADPAWNLAPDIEIVSDPRSEVGFATRLFQDPVRSLRAYSREQVNQGLWLLLCHQLCEWLWDDEIPLQLRLECIGAMPTFFREIIAVRPVGDVDYMWWDLIKPFEEEPDRAVVEAMFQSLRDVLSIPDRECQRSALHGLGHIEHDKIEELIRDYLDAHPEFNSWDRKEAEDVILRKLL
jgi:hypothetical protein